MDDQKDRYGDKLHDLEKVREDQWAIEQDRALLEKMRARQHAELHCPRCAAQLVPPGGGELATLVCPNGHGAWLEGTALERLNARTK
ncbi:MAG: zf-TFIIB domain-containing protein [Deltaproteobacteria bacterium]|nr:zf-TFIIB domain-containing protein [Deltaproteobacteria bacterium]